MSVLHEHEPPDKQSELLAELKAIRREQSALRRLLDEFCGAYRMRACVQASRLEARSMIFKTLEDGCYLAADAECGSSFDRSPGRERLALVGELSVSCGMLGTQAIDGELTAGSFNFHNIRDRDDWAKRLARLARMGGKIEFGRLLEELCRLVIAAEREGITDAVILRTARVRQAAPMFDILGMQHRGASSAPFGEGDSLKSWLALKQANEQARAGVRVGYFDWELDAPEQRLRQATIDPELPDIIYVRCERPLI